MAVVPQEKVSHKHCLVGSDPRLNLCRGLVRLQDTRQQLQAMQKTLEAELQGLVSQASSLETQLAAEPAKQRALALQV